MAALPDHWETPEPPAFPAGAGWLWAAFRDLDTERPIIQAGAMGGVPGRIPWSAADRWARRHGITGFDFEYLLRALSVMDGVLISHATKGA